MNEVGHNKPPSMIEVCDQVAGDLNGWLAEHPVILTEDEVRDAKLLLDRSKLGLKDLEDERDKKVRPLNEQVKTINDEYRPTKGIVSTLNEELGKRIEAYILAEEAKRIAEAREAARRAAEAEAAARAAERAEQEALDARNTGELGIDIKTATTTADTAFREYERAERAAQVAEKATHVKVGGGFSRATSLRKVKVYNITDAAAALHAIGVTDDIRDAIVKGAKAYHEEHGEIPPGILMHEERKI